MTETGYGIVFGTPDPPPLSVKWSSVCVEQVSKSRAVSVVLCVGHYAVMTKDRLSALQAVRYGYFRNYIF